MIYKNDLIDDFEVEELESRFEMGWIRFEAKGELCVHFDSDGNAILTHDASEHESIGGGGGFGPDNPNTTHEL